MIQWNEGRIAVTGAASGLGNMIVDVLDDRGWEVEALDILIGHDVADAKTLPALPSDVVCVINCAGINGAEWFEDVTPDHFDRIMNVNARALMTTTQWALPALKANNGTVLNIVSNASHMPMTSSLAYNASKAAAHMITLQMARELTKRYGITVFGISPNKLAGTGMSRAIEENVQRVRGWTAEYAAAYQAAALLTGQETDPETLAEFIGFLLSSKQRHLFLSGCVLPYGA